MARTILLWLLLLGGLSLPGCATRKSGEGATNEEAVQTFDAAWKIINDTHFDTNFNGVNWTALRDELRPKAAAAKSSEEAREVIQQMLDRLGESHMRVIPGKAAAKLKASSSKGASAAGSTSSSGVPGNLGFSVRIREGEALVSEIVTNGPAAQAGVRPGWILRELDGQSIPALLRSFGASAERTAFLAWKAITLDLDGSAGSVCELQFLDGADRLVKFSLTRAPDLGEPVKLGNFPTLYAHLQTNSFATPSGKHAGWIRFNMFMIPIAASFDQAIDAFRHQDGIILDLRGNIGGLAAMVMGMAGHFTPEKKSLGLLKNRTMELNFYTNPRLANPAGKRVEPFAGPVALLVDDISLSAAEIFAVGLQAIHRARVFGERTGGQALPAIFDKLPNGDILYHVFGDFVTPTGARLERAGVIPDELVPLSRQALLQGRDVPLEEALRWIDQNAPAR